MGKNKIRLFGVVVMSLLPLFLPAEIPAGYYKNADGKQGEALRQALHSIIASHTEISYGSLGEQYAKTDVDADGKIWDMYSTCGFSTTQTGCSQSEVCQCWNKEHSVPSSWFKKGTPMYSDLFHVIPTDARVNNYRGNMPYGETNNTAYIAGDSHSLGHIGSSSFSGFSGTVFEPDDEYKGDIARNYLYMATCYTTTNFTQSSEGTVVFTYSNEKSGLTAYAVNLFLKWHRQDPVSQKEIDRNNAVYGVQHNRNPFIDYPYLAEYIWGEKKGSNVSFAADLVSSSDEGFVPSVSDGSRASLSPYISVSKSRIVFASVLAGMSGEQTFTLTGNKLSSGITMSITGDADVFSVSPASIAAAAANGTNSIKVTYSPKSVGSHSAVLTIKCAQTEDVTVSLIGSCSKECNLQWIVNGAEYMGEGDTQVAEGSVPQNIPSDIESCSATSSVFVGWTATPFEGVRQEAPGDLFMVADEAPVVNTDVRFYAVFANVTTIEGSGSKETTADFTSGYTNGQDVTSKTIGNVEISFEQASASNPARYYTGGSAVRVYAKSQIRVKGNNVSKIVLEFGSNDNSNTISVNTGTFSTDTWTGLADEVLFTIGGTKSYRAISRMTVTSSDSQTQTIYSDYIVSCDGSTDIEAALGDTAVDKAEKLIIDGRLYIKVGEAWYDAMGRKVVL